MTKYKAFYISDGANPNYLASIHKVKEVFDIDGADNIKRIVIDGRDVVVGKNITVGSVVVYFPPESVICEKYLRSNSLYNISNYKKNASARYVDAELYRAEQSDNDEERTLHLIKAKSFCGFFEANGRVKTIKIRGVYSMGFAMLANSITAMDSVFSVVDWASLDGLRFDVANGETICWKHIVKQPIEYKRPPQKFYEKTMRKLLKNNKNLVDGQFRLHYDTEHLSNVISGISPYTFADVTVKFDGAAGCVSNVLVNKKLNVLQRLAKWVGFPVKDKDYYVIYASHRVIKNEEINPLVTEGFYGVDIWKPVYELLKDALTEGQSIYGEVVGYVNGTNEMIQPDRDYGCKPGEWKFMIYRITTTDETGNVVEWDVSKIVTWVTEMCKCFSDLSEHLIAPVVLYSGKLSDMYNIDPELDDWSDKFIDAVANDVDRLGMELDEPLCNIVGPREGVVFRICDKAYKFKSKRHCLLESERADKGYINIEDNN